MLTKLYVCSYWYFGTFVSMYVAQWHVVTMSLLSPPLLHVGMSPLHVASEFGHSEVVNALVKNGRDLNQATKVMKLLYSKTSL